MMLADDKQLLEKTLSTVAELARTARILSNKGHKFHLDVYKLCVTVK